MLPRRNIDIFWSMIAAWGLFHFRAHEQLWSRITDVARQQGLQRYITIPAFLAIYSVCWAALCLPVNALRQRFSSRAWLGTLLQRGLMFIIIGSLLLICQILSPTDWWTTFQIVLLILMLTMTYFAADLIPPGAICLHWADEESVDEIRATTGRAVLPPVFIASGLEMAMCLGIGHRNILLVPEGGSGDKPQLTRALRNRSRVQLLKAVLLWGWIVLGLRITMHLANAKLLGSPLLIGYLTTWMSAWVGAALIVFPFAWRV